MATKSSLEQNLKAIDEAALKEEFLAKNVAVGQIENCCRYLASWSIELRRIEKNTASAFLVEMQRASHDVAYLVSIAQYVPAAAAMRTCFETALYYSYFRNHPAELLTLVHRPDFYVSKADVMEYLKIHSPSFKAHERSIGLVSKIEKWYSEISAIVHGQIPGKWVKRISLPMVSHDEKVMDNAVKYFCECASIVNNLFLLGFVADGCWDKIHFNAKKVFLKNMTAEHRANLKLDGK